MDAGDDVWLFIVWTVIQFMEQRVETHNHGRLV